MLLVASGATASEPVVDWTAPEECPGWAEVESWLDAVTAERADAGRRATVEIEVTGDLYRARISIVGKPASERQLESTNCAELARSAVVVLSVELAEETAPQLAEAEPASPSTPTQSDPEVVVPRLVPRSSPVRDVGVRTSTRHRQASVVAALGAGTGLGDGPSQRADVLVQVPSVGFLSLGGRGRAERGHVVNPSGSLDAHWWLLAVGPEACAVHAFQNLRAGACVRAELGAVSADGGVADEALWAAAATAAYIEWGTDVRLWGGVDLDVRMNRPVFIRADGATLQRTPSLGGAALLGVALALP
ncbi:MAG: hypothetical protein R3B07_15315 [Polyangiaceae bacterium]